MVDINEFFLNLSKLINNHTCVVDSWLLNELKREYNQGSYSKYENVEALALEKSLLKEHKNIIEKPTSYRHDLPFKNINVYIDLKRRPKIHSNISLSKVKDKEYSIQIGQLTHFVSYTQNKEHNYKIGDILTFKMDWYINASKGLELAQSRNNFKLLPKNCLHLSKTML